MDLEKIGKLIATKRAEFGMTQSDLAEKLSISDRAVSKWERGLNLPEVSKMRELCSILDISLNELFSGEQKERHLNRNDMERTKLFKEKGHFVIYINRYIIASIILLAVILTIIVIILQYFFIQRGIVIDEDLKYSQIYSFKNDVIGMVDIEEFGLKNIDFDIGANKYGVAVFKNPSRAFKRLKKDYREGIDLIKREFSLKPLTAFNFRDYGVYGWQVTTGSKKAQEEANFVSRFMDIYENSFKNPE